MSSSPSCLPVFDLHSNHQEGQHCFRGWFYDKDNAYVATQHAAGGVLSSPFPSISPPSLAIYTFDQWTTLLNTDCFSNLCAGCCLGVPAFDLSGSQDLDLSSCDSSTPPSSMASPLDGDSPLYFTSPDLLSRALLSPFKVSDVGGQDLVASVRPYQDHVVAWPQPTDIHHSISPGQQLHPHISLPEQITADVPNQSPYGTVTNNLGALPGDFVAPPTPMETTALGLYYSDTAQSPDVPSVSTLPENNASAPSVFQRVPPPTENWTFRAVDPAPKASRAKRAQSDKAGPPDADTDTAASTTTSTSHGVKVEPLVECKQCGYLQLTRRMGDFRRHLKKHEAEHLSRVVCCGVPPAHPAVARLRPGHLTRLYDGHSFSGGCGRSYSRMDALQRHLKKSGCVGGNARDHQSWRKLYFLDGTRRPHKPGESSESRKHAPASSPLV